MKRVDLYAQPWKMPKWLGAAIGGVFGFILLGTGLIIFHLVRPAQAATPPPVETASHDSVAPSQGKLETLPPVQHEVSKRVVTPQKAHAKKLAKASKRAKPAKMVPHKDRAKILARHDSSKKRKDKDALDRMLGL